MRKVIFIAMAALALLTAQCKKNEQKPEEKAMVPITGNVDFGGSKTAITTAGYITPVDGDKIYIYHEGDYAGYMTCTPTTGQQFTCSGEIEEDCLGKTCTFMYLGTGSTEADGTTGICETSTTISFADQTGVSVSDGKISGLDKFHVGSCIAEVSSEGTVTLPMVSKMAIAYFQLKDAGGNAFANRYVAISGVSATATISKTDGTLVGSGTGSITVLTDDEGCFYMALVPQSGEVTFTFSGLCDGTKEFPYGIRECSFYSEQGSGSPLQVAVTKLTPKFTVDASGTTVEFAPGNLYWDGNSSEWKFEANQWDYRTFPGWPDESAVIDGVQTYTPEGTVGSFFWDNSAETARAQFYHDYESFSEDDDVTLFTNATATTAKSSFQVSGETAGTWRALSGDEFGYLLSREEGTLSACVTLTDVNVFDAVILPDGSDAIASNVTTRAQVDLCGAVFFPNALCRSNDMYSHMEDYGGYWWSDRYYYDIAWAGKCMVIDESEGVDNTFDWTYFGNPVRLVR